MGWQTEAVRLENTQEKKLRDTSAKLVILSNPVMLRDGTFKGSDAFNSSAVLFYGLGGQASHPLLPGLSTPPLPVENLNEVSVRSLDTGESDQIIVSWS